MSSDRDTRQRVEWVQTRLREIAPELALAETPGHTEKLDGLQQAVREARDPARQAQERLDFTRSQLLAAQRAVADLHLAAQAEQTNDLHPLLVALLVPGCTALIIAATYYLATSKALIPELAAVASVVSAFALGAVMRARVFRPDSPRTD